MRKLLLFLLIIAGLINCRFIYAWNYTGHSVIAIIAYDLMDTESRNEVLDLIKHHPRYKEDFLDAMPDTSKFWSQMEKEQWIFAQIAFWPDIARGFKDEMKDKYHHGTWHYINLGIFPNEELKKQFDTPLPANTNLVYSESSEYSRMNIMEALGYILEKFKSEETTDMDKAILLCWLFHLVGDIHQPLHCSAMFTPRLFSEGDRGGNSIKVGKYNLHSTWDWAVGGEKEISVLAELSTTLFENEELNSFSKDAKEDLNINNWLEESYSLAKSSVYTPAVCDLVVAAEYSNSTDYPSFILSDDYKSTMEQVAKERVILAAYRLIAILGIINL